MKFYYAHQTRRWLTEDEQSRFHLDYDPQDSKDMALQELRQFLARRVILHIDWAKSWMSVMDKSWAIE